jgi:hypothetical protein
VISLADRCVVVQEDSQNFRDNKEPKMANKNLTLKLTADQQKQIKAATGKDVSEISLKHASTGQLSVKDLELVTAGLLRRLPC